MRAASLDPARTSATPIASLARSVVVGAGLEAIAGAITRHFPENVFADLDLVAAELERTRSRAGEAAARVQAERIAAVHGLFGRETVLRFRYAHDFLYGFDWARWVARDPAARAAVGPYDDAFLSYSEERAAQLCVLVAKRDPKYGPLPPDAHRNPFPFRRDPEAERAIHRALAAAGAIPVPAWNAAASPAWDRPYTTLREAQARALGLALDESR